MLFSRKPPKGRIPRQKLCTIVYGHSLAEQPSLLAHQDHDKPKAKKQMIGLAVATIAVRPGGGD